MIEINHVKVRLPQLCNEGFLDEVWLLKYLGDLHWMQCQEGDVYQSFIYIDLTLPLTNFKYNDQLIINQKTVDKGSICESIFDINGYHNKLISAPVRSIDGKLHATKKSKPNNQELKYRRSCRKMLDTYIGNYKTIPYRDFNGIGIMYFANYVRIENEFIGPAINGRTTCYFKNIESNDVFSIYHQSKEIIFANNNKIMYHSLRK